MARTTKTGKVAEKDAGPRLNEIVEHRVLQPSLKLWKLYVPDIARRVKPGQFVVLRGDDYAERIPLTVADFDREKGTITVIFQEVGASTRKLGQFQLHETILDVVGRTLDDALRLETINAYSSLGDFSEARERLVQFYSKGTKEAG